MQGNKKKIELNSYKIKYYIKLQNNLHTFAFGVKSFTGLLAYSPVND